MTKTTEYPLDFAALAKGDYISVGELEKILCMRADSPRFGFAVMSLIRRIAGRLERDGRPMTLKQERGGGFVCWTTRGPRNTTEGGGRRDCAR